MNIVTKRHQSTLIQANINKYRSKLNNIVINGHCTNNDHLNIADNQPIEQSIDQQYCTNNLPIHSFDCYDRHWSMKRISNLVIILTLFIIVTPAIKCDIFSSTATIQSLMHL